MGFWYYCTEACCGASAYRWSPPLSQFAGGSGFGRVGEPAINYNPIDWRPPLLGSDLAITKQSDGWVMLRGMHGIRDDGALWRGWDRLLPFDPGPWKWVTESGDTGAGIKSDGTLWTWGRDIPGDGSVGGWGATSFHAAQGVHARINRKLIGFPDLEWTQKGQRTLSPTGLGVTIEGCQPNPESGLTAKVGYLTSSGFFQGAGYDAGSPPGVVFDPPGAKATPVISGGRVGYYVVTDGGTYNYRPRVTVDPPPGGVDTFNNRYSAVATPVLHLDKASSEKSLLPKIGEAEAYYIEVTNEGSGYTIPPVVEFDPPGAKAEAILGDGGSVSFIRVIDGGSYSYQVQPSVSVSPANGDTSGGGCKAVAHIEGIVSEVEILDPGSYTRETQYSPDSYSLAGWSDPPPPTCIGRLYRAVVDESGSDYLKPKPPTVAFGGGGKDAKAVAVVGSNGVVSGVTIEDGGIGYIRPAAPQVLVTGDGSGAIARAFVGDDGKIAKVVLLASGTEYMQDTTKVVFLPPVPPARGSGAAAIAIVGPDSSVVGVQVTDAGSGYFTPEVTVSFQSEYGTGAAAYAEVDAEGTVTKATIVTGGAGYYEPAPPIVSISSKVGSSGKVSAVVNSAGKVTSLYISNAGSGYDPELYYGFDPTVNLTFSPQPGSLGSGGKGRAYVISKYRHPTDALHEFRDDNGLLQDTYSLRTFLSEAQLSPGGVISISVDEPLAINFGLVSPPQAWNASAMPAWRIQGGEGKILEAYDGAPFNAMTTTQHPLAPGAGIKYEGEVNGQPITHEKLCLP